ncbi:MAG: hypothetical protein EHM21_02710 [Chloroflexi bacterium]|nr:MAG: hypothetical protein EHM21_02710 [Chloroflexota bacterium]
MGLPILVLDFDGVCHSYTSGWQGVDVIPDPPVHGLEAFLEAALSSFEVSIHSSRSAENIGRAAMQAWFARWVSPSLCAQLRFPVAKPPAMVTLDDRAMTFTGTWPDVERLRQFQPWTRHTPPPNEQPSAAGTGFAEPGRADARAQLCAQILEGLEEQIRQLAHEPDMQSELEAIWVLVERLRRLP